MDPHVVILTGDCEETIEDEPMTHPYTRDPFQQHALAQIMKGNNILVTAHTSCGKTTPAIDAIAYQLRKSHEMGENRVTIPLIVSRHYLPQ